MKNVEIVTVQQLQYTAIICDKCGFTVELPDNGVEYQEFFQWKFVGGYGSVFGDCTYGKVDLCQRCVKEVLGPYVQYDENERFNKEIPY